MEVINNKKLYRFEILLENGEIASLEYRWLKGKMVLMHTFVPISARGKGVGEILVRHVLDYIKLHDLKAIVYCPYVEKFLESHPELRPE